MSSITSVNRDDLADGGSRHFAETVEEVRRALPEARVEVLTPDFCGDTAAVARVLDAGPHIFNHNMETVARLYRRVRPQADYEQSLRVLAFARQYRPDVMTKSGFMVGLGETASEVRELLRHLREHGTDIATIGQYLQPTRRHLPVAAYIEPQQFEEYRESRIVARFQNGLQRSAGSQLLHGGPGERAGGAGQALNFLLAAATAVLLILVVSTFRFRLARTDRAHAAASRAGAREAAAALVSSGRVLWNHLLVRRLLLDSELCWPITPASPRALRGRRSRCSAWPKPSTWACSRAPRGY